MFRSFCFLRFFFWEFEVWKFILICYCIFEVRRFFWKRSGRDVCFLLWEVVGVSW